MIHERRQTRFLKETGFLRAGTFTTRIGLLYSEILLISVYGGIYLKAGNNLTIRFISLRTSHIKANMGQLNTVTIFFK